ncbi:hypothetical protein [Natronorubrum halalkaliphilum]|uniref:hypothetical protein n=1 Tax=Natronorubrum halalkaliphilum TaxID=2691917 RepID=UPI001914EA15|nr:hypothetical protein [Natronorubrum halalkaliphilum]
MADERSPTGETVEAAEVVDTVDEEPAIATDRSDDDDRAASDELETDAQVAYLDCETVRVSKPVDDVLLSLFWWDEQGQIGTISEPVGSVDGDRTISATEAFGEFAHGPVITEVELFEAGTPVVPGGGDVLVSNPDADSCAESVRDEYDGPGELEGGAERA